MKKFFSKDYILQLKNWFWKGKYYVGTILLIFFFILCVTKGSISTQKYSSYIMLIIGLFILFQQQWLDTKKYSDFRPNTMSNWLKSYPKQKDVVIKLETGKIKISGNLIKMRTQTSPNESIEKKVEFLLRNLSSIQDSISNLDDRLNQLKNSQSCLEDKFDSELNNYDIAIKNLVFSHIIGDYDKNFFAIAITFLGTILQLIIDINI